MDLLVQFTEYHDHLSGELVKTDIDEHAAETMLELAKARHLAKGWVNESTSRLAVHKAAAANDPEIQRLTDTLDGLKARRKLLGIMVDSQGRDANVISRELSRRIGREPAQRRADKYS